LPGGVEKLTREILRLAREEADAIIRKAKSEAQYALEGSRKEAENEYKTVLERERANLEMERQQVISDAVLRSQSLILEAKEKLIVSVYDEAFGRIKNFTSSPRYEDALVRLASQALSMVGSSDVELLVNEADAKRLSQLMLREIGGARRLASVKVSSTRIKAIGGVVARSSTGKIEVDNTIDGRFSIARNTLRTEISKMLFGGDSV